LLYGEAKPSSSDLRRGKLIAWNAWTMQAKAKAGHGVELSR
jgi:hypothetical protein